MTCLQEKLLARIDADILPEEYGGSRKSVPPIPNAEGVVENLDLDPIPW